jgi:hypothetical protein
VAGGCPRYDLANPDDIEVWPEKHLHLVDVDRVLGWIERLCDDPQEIGAQQEPGVFGIYGYQTAFIDGEDVDVVFVERAKA